MGIMSLSEIMDKSIEVLRKNIKTIIMFTLGYGVICFIAAFILLFLGGIFTAIIAAVMDSVGIGIAALIMLIFIVTSLVFAANVGIIEICGQEFFKRKVEAFSAIKLSFKNIFKVIGMLLIIGVISLPLLAGAYGVGKLVINIFDAMDSAIGHYGWSILVFITLFVLIIMLSAVAVIAYITIFSFSLPAMIIENIGVFKSIKRSWKLVRYNFWKVFGCVLLFFLCVTAIRMSIQSFITLIASIVYFILQFLSIPMEYLSFMTAVYTQLSWPLDILSFAVITPIHGIMMTMLYFNQRIKKEGFDMRIRLRELQRNNERKQSSEFTIYNGPVQN